MPKKAEISGLISIFPEFNPLRIKYKDIFDLKAFYETLREYFLEQGWGNTEGDIADHWETYYGEKIDGGGAKELWMRWRLVKNAPDTSFIRYYLDIDWHVLALVSAEVVRDGQKLKVNKGECELNIRAYLDPLYKKQFEKDFFLKQILNIFSKRVYRRTLEQRKKELYQEVYALQNFIKQWFKMKRYLPYEESKAFFPSQAWPSHQK